MRYFLWWVGLLMAPLTFGIWLRSFDAGVFMLCFIGALVTIADRISWTIKIETGVSASTENSEVKKK